MNRRYEVARLEDLPPGRSMLVTAGVRQLALHNVGGTLHATSAHCPHRQGPMSQARHQGPDIVVCPWHDWPFDVQTGQSPLIPGASVEVFPVAIENGRVFVTLEEP